MKIAIIDYGLGNLTSVKNAISFLGFDCIITRNPEEIKNADKLILPGVGAFKEGMENLKKFNLIQVLNEEVIKNKKPILGICLGMQLMCNKSYEGGEFEGLKWFDADVLKFTDDDLRIPHVGWNDVNIKENSLFFSKENSSQAFYFVHSYYLSPLDKEIVSGVCNYGIDFCAVAQKENIHAVQFHPEKSQKDGLELLKKFCELKC